MSERTLVIDILNSNKFTWQTNDGTLKMEITIMMSLAHAARYIKRRNHEDDAPR
ncbi:hypothetical protein [Bacillus sp. P14.5]|uniref:hypothetical protein n=1 Tax=Bacillus sp. P14.5 TaxID=1983400 RepID=UPI0013B06BEE|nr:hypothetical protein [Bacillus sp. P14.5]